ncbi:MAG: hypothetical protein IJZ79_04370, partial [Bacilli bacterium]|nr:hypothetical protein [Bacilli bacterium]
TSPDDGVIVKGNFKGLIANQDKVMLLENIDYNEETTESYYLWIWLDEAETSTETMNQNFRFELGGVCSDLLPEPDTPVIKDGLIPVTIANNGAATTISKTDPNWYSYGNKEWANAILVTDSSRSKYLNTSNVPVTESDILAYFVWIPRYAYKIWTTDATTTTSPQEIGIRWERSSKEYANGLQIGEYRTHPAFWWDTDGDRQIDSGETISGIWVGKFETTGSDTTPTIKPKTTPLVSQAKSVQFDTALKFTGASLTNKATITYGTGTSQYGLTSNIDSHMMKNSEWGAVAYLSHSIYGINTEIRKNNFNEGNQTGCGASYELKDSADTVTTCAISYGDSIEYPQSTTGNITGIFDTSGGKWDQVMGNFANTEVNGEFASGFFSQISNQKYYDYYNFDAVTSCTIVTCGGHALFETKSWYNDYASFVFSSYPWFSRGGSYVNDSHGGAFYFSRNGGDAYASDGFRVVLF